MDVSNVKFTHLYPYYRKFDFLGRLGSRKRRRPMLLSTLTAALGCCFLLSSSATRPFGNHWSRLPLLARDWTSFSNSTHFRHEMSIRHVMLIRGGDMEGSSESNETATDDWELAGGDKEVMPANSIHLSNLLPSLFQISNDVKSEASLETDEDILVNKAFSSSIGRPNNSRGGAMVKAKPPPRRLLAWLAPLETHRVAPLSDRLLVDERAKVTEEASKSSSAERESTLSRNRRKSFDEARTGTCPREATKVNPRGETLNTRKLDVVSVIAERDASEFEEEILDANVSNTTSTMTLDEAQSEFTESTSLPSEDSTSVTAPSTLESPYVSSGYWTSIDKVLTFGYAQSHPSWRVSRHLRVARKAAARMTGLHGVLSGKVVALPEREGETEVDQRMGIIRRRIAAIARARENVDRITSESRDKESQGIWPWSRKENEMDEFTVVLTKNPDEILEEQKRKERVRQIDKLIADSQRRLQELACEKDVLQRRLNPLWNYTTDASARASENRFVTCVRKFNFPPPDLVEEYLDIMFSTGKLVKLNHTDLWKNNLELEDDDDDDELANPDYDAAGRKRRNGNGGSGNWLLRYGLGEKIGEAAETAAYKSVCAAIMSVLARGLSSLHGVNVMAYADIRLFMEQTPDLPPFAAGIIPGSGRSSNYAQGAIEQAMRRGTKKRRKKKQTGSQLKDPFRNSADDAFIQRDAVVETLLSQCQISAPLLKLFPIAWQRAMLGNVITLITSIIADFFEGLEFQILGYRLSFAFTPITESDMLRRLGSIGEGLSSRHRGSPEQFEAAVRATADDLAEELNFLDRWHERALGSGLLRMQIANLIARLVLTLADDVLSGARMDLWAAHAGGPRLVAGLEYRTTATPVTLTPTNGGSAASVATSPPPR